MERLNCAKALRTHVMDSTPASPKRGSIGIRRCGNSILCLRKWARGIPWLSRGFHGDSDGKESACSSGDMDSILWVGKIPWRREWQPTPVFLPREPHGQRSLVTTVYGVIRSHRDQCLPIWGTQIIVDSSNGASGFLFSGFPSKSSTFSLPYTE